MTFDPIYDSQDAQGCRGILIALALSLLAAAVVVWLVAK